MRYKSGKLRFIISNVLFWYIRKIEDFLTVDLQFTNVYGQNNENYTITQTYIFFFLIVVFSNLSILMS